MFHIIVIAIFYYDTEPLIEFELLLVGFCRSQVPLAPTHFRHYRYYNKWLSLTCLVDLIITMLSPDSSHWGQTEGFVINVEEDVLHNLYSEYLVSYLNATLVPELLKRFAAQSVECWCEIYEMLSAWSGYYGSKIDGRVWTNIM